MEKLSKILYNDKFIELYNDKLVIKTYYFPIGTNKIISIKNIRCIYFKNQVDTILSTKGWGMAITVWWGCDMKRQFPSTKTNFYNVALDCGTFIKQGFTVVDVHKFLKALRPLTNAPMENRFPNAFEKRDKLVEVEKEVSEEKINKNDENFKSMKDVLDICEPPPSYDKAVGSSSKNIFS
uniref:Uncharacterized protein n=1 Tax=Panagrolaimus sp. PS1159 TaxID=55785 RepID=A0AC35GNU6_9BILA